MTSIFEGGGSSKQGLNSNQKKGYLGSNKNRTIAIYYYKWYIYKCINI